MPVVIIGNKVFNPVTESPSQLIEKMLADIIHNILGGEYALTFSASSNLISVGDTIIGAISHTTALVTQVNIKTGSLALGNAYGTIRMRDLRGDFIQNEILKVDNINCATLAAGPRKHPVYGGLVNQVDYVSGGPETYPDAGDTVVSVRCSFNFIYPTQNNNPYV